jgi:hypothetical protein
VYFGFKLLKDGIEMKNEGPSDELAEVEEELEKKKGDDQEEVSTTISYIMHVRNLLEKFIGQNHTMTVLRVLVVSK